MRYCGLDIASVSSYFYISDSKGKKVSAGWIATNKATLTRRLKPYVRNGLSIAIEAGNQTAWIYDVLTGLGADVTVVNPTKVKLIAESRRKTDKIDAKILCDLLRIDALPHPVHMPSQEARELRGLLVARRQLVTSRVKLCNVVRGMVRQEGVQLKSGALSSFIGWERLMAYKFKHSHLRIILKEYYHNFRSLTESIRSLDKELAKKEREDERVSLLQSMPGVGRLSALTFVAAVDDIHRFSSSRKLVSYSGLAPTVRSSGERTEYGSISREGRSELRAVWVQIAHRVGHVRDPGARPLQRWFRRVISRRGKKTATVALTRKLLTIAYQLLKNEVDYDPARIGRAA